MADERRERVEDPAPPARPRGRGVQRQDLDPVVAESVHDFMHAKVVVADDTSFVGSFNFSRSGERNAENVLEIRDPAIADLLATFVDEIRARYPRATPPGIVAA